MPSSRRARSLLKQCGEASINEFRQLAEMGADVPLHERAVSPEERATFQQQRAKLRDEFARLSPSQRKRRAREYMGELVSISLSTRGFWGSWTLHFEPLIDDDEY